MLTNFGFHLEHIEASVKLQYLNVTYIFLININLPNDREIIYKLLASNVALLNHVTHGNRRNSRSKNRDKEKEQEANLILIKSLNIQPIEAASNNFPER